MIIREWFSEELVEKRTKKFYKSESLKQLARENIKLDDKQLNKELAEKMINPYYVTNRVLQVDFNFTLECHRNNHANSKLTTESNNPDFGIEVRYNNKII